MIFSVTGVTLKPNFDFETFKVIEYKQAKLVLSCGNGSDSKLEWCVYFYFEIIHKPC